MVVSSARVKIFMEKYKEICMDILTPEDGTTTLSQNIGHQSFNPKPQLHHCKSMKAPTVTHLLQQRGIEKVLKNVVL